MYTKTPHPFRKTAWYLEFPTGHTWSCVNLGALDFLNHENAPDIVREAMEDIGQMYDTMGGRYEAMIIGKSGVDPDHLVRAHSWEELFTAVEQYEKDNFMH